MSRTQITQKNATEKLAADNLYAMVRRMNFNSDGNALWIQSATWQGAADKTKYGQCVRAAGDTMLDLLRTIGNFPDHIQLGDTVNFEKRFGTEKLVFLRYPDSTIGAVAFYSPSARQWNEDSGDPELSIKEALISATTTFPNAGDPDDKFHYRARITFGNLVENNRVQVVIVNGVAIITPSTGRPQFIFLRLRNPNWPSVIQANP